MPAPLQDVSPTVVSKTFVVNCPQARAFEVFTQKMASWWPPTHHLGDAPFVQILMDPHEGGRWYEVNSNGEEVQWGTVLAWEPPHRVMLSWHLGVDFQLEADLSRASEIELCFAAADTGGTRVQFEHRHLDRHGEGYERLQRSLNDGWGLILPLFAGAAAPGQTPHS